MQPNPRYANTGARLGAYLIDALIIFPVGLLVFGIVSSIVSSGGGSSADRLSQAILTLERAQARSITVLIMQLLAVLYHAILESGPLQASIGKLALGLRVVNLHGARVSFGQAFVRALLRAIPPFALTQPFSAKRQAIHDMIAGCLVVEKSPVSYPAASPAPLPAPLLVQPHLDTPPPISSAWGRHHPTATIVAVAAATMVLTLVMCAAFFFIQRNARYTTVCFGKDGPFGITFNAENGQFWYGGIYKVQYSDTELRIYHLKASQSPEAILNGVKGLQVYRDCRSFSDLPRLQPVHIDSYRKSIADEAAKKAREVEERERLRHAVTEAAGMFASAPGQTGVVPFGSTFRHVPTVSLYCSWSLISAAAEVTAVLSATTSNFTWRNSAVPGTFDESRVEQGIIVRRPYGGSVQYRALCNSSP